MPDENSAYMSIMRHNARTHPAAGIRQNSGLAPYPLRRAASDLRSCGVGGFCSLPLPLPFPFLQNKKTVSSIGISNF
ncbi:hypothetical protein HMPREF1981_02955 [Bacteroides pyogenes F0041]|uniref:Uncharacterized protein n=2 Tax=Bacteroides pyogenes TaxID=310300 RepID=U2BUC0_9BACE|nr:hypothetical protein HMPREF1981_02955 [Bacteroides pyogenes F0041]